MFPLHLGKTRCPQYRDHLSAAPHFEFSTNVQNMSLDRVHAQDEVLSDLPIRSTIQQEL